MEIKEILDKNQWEEFLTKQEFAPYIQNWNSGQMYKKLGNTVKRIGIFDNANLIGIALIVVEVSRRGKFLFLPYGPVFEKTEEEIFKQLIKYLKVLGQEQGAVFIKISPFLESTEWNKTLYRKYGFFNSPLHVLAEITWILDLNKDENTLMAGMRKNTRNLIRRAIKDGVKIKKETSMDAIKRFLVLHQETVRIHNFVPYKDQFFIEHLMSYKDDSQVIIFEAWHDDLLIASAIVMYYGDTASYRHGASLHSKIPATYLLQWSAIQEAKTRGLLHYNFWGIYDGENKKHPFYGISFFKKGFGGYKKQLLHCQDLPIKISYWPKFYAIDTYRKHRRGFGSDSY